MHKQTFQFRLYPTPAQESALVHTLDECRWLYNHFLEERKVAWQETRASIGRYDQINRILTLKAERPALGDVHSQVLQNVAMRIDLAFKAFFRRVQEQHKEPGYPRFRGPGRYDSFCYPGSGYKMDGKRVYLSKIGHVKAIMQCVVEGTIKTCCVKRTSTGKWYVTFSCVVDDAPLPVTESAWALTWAWRVSPH
jgi:putative transposase